MYGCERWAIKKAEHRRIDILKLWCCWLLRVPWTTRRSNQSILKEINPEYSLEGLMLKLKLQYFGHMMQRADSLVKTLILGKIEGRRRKGWQRMRWMDHWPNGHDFEQTLGDGEGQGSLVSCSPWSRKESDTTERLNHSNRRIAHSRVPVNVQISTTLNHSQTISPLPFEKCGCTDRSERQGSLASCSPQSQKKSDTA